MSQRMDAGAPLKQPVFHAAPPPCGHDHLCIQGMTEGDNRNQFSQYATHKGVKIAVLCIPEP